MLYINRQLQTDRRANVDKYVPFLILIICVVGVVPRRRSGDVLYGRLIL